MTLSAVITTTIKIWIINLGDKFLNKKCNAYLLKKLNLNVSRNMPKSLCLSRFVSFDSFLFHVDLHYFLHDEKWYIDEIGKLYSILSNTKDGKTFAQYLRLWKKKFKIWKVRTSFFWHFLASPLPSLLLLPQDRLLLLPFSGHQMHHPHPPLPPLRPLGASFQCCILP